LTSRRFKLVLALSGLFACVAWFGSSAAQARADASQFAADIVRVDADPKVDGTLDDPLWQKATHVQLTWDYQFRRPASEKTMVCIVVKKSR